MRFSPSIDSVRKTVVIDQGGSFVTISNDEAPVPTQPIDLRKRDRVDADQADSPDAADHYLKRYQARVDGEEEETTYYLTITDTNWRWGNPTAVTTSSDKETTITYLLFSKTTMMWYDPYDIDSSTIIWASFPSTMTTIATSAEEEEDSTSEGEASDEPTDMATSIGDAISTTDIDAPTTSDTGITGATESPETAPGTGSSDLPQGAIIGISVGISILTVAVVMVLLIIFRRRHKKAAHDSATRGGSPAPQEPPKMEEVRPAEHPFAQSYSPPFSQPLVSPAVSEHHSPDHVGMPRAASAPVSEIEQQGRFPVELANQQPSAAQMFAHSVAQLSTQPGVHTAAPRQYQAYHPSYSQNNQGFVAELPAENHTR